MTSAAILAKGMRRLISPNGPASALKYRKEISKKSRIYRELLELQNEARERFWVGPNYEELQPVIIKLGQQIFLLNSKLEEKKTGPATNTVQSSGIILMEHLFSNLLGERKFKIKPLKGAIFEKSPKYSQATPAKLICNAAAALGYSFSEKTILRRIDRHHRSGNESDTGGREASQKRP